MPEVIEISQRAFDSVIRLVKNAPLDRITMLRTATFKALKRLKTKRDKSKAVLGLPKGSDQQDVMSLIKWVDKVQRQHTKAIEQVVAIDATCVARIGK